MLQYTLHPIQISLSRTTFPKNVRMTARKFEEQTQGVPPGAGRRSAALLQNGRRGDVGSAEGSVLPGFFQPGRTIAQRIVSPRCEKIAGLPDKPCRPFCGCDIARGLSGVLTSVASDTCAWQWPEEPDVFHPRHSAVSLCSVRGSAHVPWSRASVAVIGLE